MTGTAVNFSPADRLRSPRATLGGYVILPRLIDKLRLHAKGDLPAEYRPQLLAPEPALDGRFLTFTDVDPEALQGAILSSADDEAIFAWVERHGRRRSDAEKREWAAAIEAYRPDADRAARRRAAYPKVAAGVDVGAISVFDLIDLDEGRLPFPSASSRDGDDLAARAWTGFSEALRAFIRRRVSDPHDAEDLLQDVFFRIHQRGHQLERAERLRPWLYQITRHAIVDYYRARAALPGSVELPPDLPEKPEPQSVIDELADCLHPMIERLPEAYRRAVTMADLEGQTQRDTATALGLSLSGSKSRIQRGRRLLRTMVLACCHLEVDGGGRVIDYTPRDPSCSRCAP